MQQILKRNQVFRNATYNTRTLLNGWQLYYSVEKNWTLHTRPIHWLGCPWARLGWVTINEDAKVNICVEINA